MTGGPFAEAESPAGPNQYVDSTLASRTYKCLLVSHHDVFVIVEPRHQHLALQIAAATEALREPWKISMLVRNEGLLAPDASHEPNMEGCWYEVQASQLFE
ncbi:unnamed protein product [Closterium sp. Yama58-4]|nr:unnamed protein product [Closterium sp. Yama58-4]